MTKQVSVPRKHKLIAIVLALTMIFALFPPLGTLAMPEEGAVPDVAADRTPLVPAALEGRAVSEQLYRVWFDTPAPNRTPNTTNHPGVHGRDLDWEFRSLPIGNGLMGTTIFGRTDTERISIAESSLYNQTSAGLNTFMTLYMDFGHDWSGVTNYFRELILNDATATVEYTYNGVTFTREHIASHPDQITAIRLTARDAVSGADRTGEIDVTVRPVIPFVRPDGFFWAGVRGRSATVEADPVTGTIRLFGQQENFGLQYEGQIRVITDGGNMTRHDWRFNPEYLSSIEGVGTRLAPNVYGGVTRGRGEAYDAQGLRVEGADEILILIGGLTSYQLARETDWSAVFSSGGGGAWGFPENQNRLYDVHGLSNANEVIRDRLRATVDAAEALGWEALLARHIQDYTYFFDRARLDLGGRPEDAFNMTTEARVQRYRAAHPNHGIFDPYLEELFWQFGRYLLIASSREGGLGAHLQGIWTAYEHTPWSGGWWHNINLQMNYWPAFNTNLADLFQPYADFSEAFRPAAQRGAQQYLHQNAGSTAHPGLDPRLTGPVGRYIGAANPVPGQYGWITATGVWPYHVAIPTFNDHSGPGTGGMTTALFWEYWEFTRDLDILENVTWSAIEGMAQFLMRTLRWCYDEELYLVWFSASPEHVLTRPIPGLGSNYYRTIGSLFDQQMVWDVYYTVINAARILEDAGRDPGIDWNFITQIEREIDYLAPVIIGRSGQVKEYREEEFYGEIIHEFHHRHISHLLGLYPGNVFNDAPHWMDAARTTLDYRGDGVTGWSQSHTLHFRARMGEGNHAYHILRNLMGNHVRYNMWAQHEPFQIDGNFGGISGMAEMLVQSHEGYISLLPARPETWGTGSFTGFTARGGFEVDASWTDGQVESFTLWSSVGGPARVSFPYIGYSGVQIRDAFDRIVATNPIPPATWPAGIPGEFDLIEFDTVPGMSYTISGIRSHNITAPASDLTLTTGLFYFGGSDRQAGVDLRWTASPDAVAYRVYVARDSDRDYTYIDTVTGTNFLHGPLTDTQGHQFTYRILAIGADDRASVGVTSLIIPARPASSAEGSFIEYGAGYVLGVYIQPEIRMMPEHMWGPDTPTNTPTAIPPAGVYRLYEYVGGEFVYRASSAFRMIYLETATNTGIFYVATDDFVTGRTREEKVRVTIIPIGAPTFVDNVFLHRPVRTNPEALLSHPASNLTDGNHGSRFAVNDGHFTAPGPLVVYIDIGGETTISEVRFVQFQNRANRTVFELSNDGGATWHEIFDRGPLGTGLSTHPLTSPYPSGSLARFSFYGTSAPTFYEIEATSGPLTMVNKAALLAIVGEANAIDLQLGFGLGKSEAPAYIEYQRAAAVARAAMISRTITQLAVDNAVAALRAAIDELPALARVTLSGIIIDAQTELANPQVDDTHPLYATLNASLDAATGLGDLSVVPLHLVNPVIYELYHALRLFRAHGVELPEDLSLTITPLTGYQPQMQAHWPDGGFFFAPVTVVLHNDSVLITRFYYTLDGREPSALDNDGVVLRSEGMTLELRHGQHRLALAGFREDGTRVTDVAEAQYMIMETANLTRSDGFQAIATTAQTMDHGLPISNVVDGNLGTRAAGIGFGVPNAVLGAWVEVDMIREVTVGSIVIHAFRNSYNDVRLGNAFRLYYSTDGDSWTAFHTGAARTQPTPANSMWILTDNPHRHVYGLALDTPITARYFRIANIDTDSLNELQFFGLPSFHEVTFELDSGTHIGGGELMQSVIHGGNAIAPTFTPPVNRIFAGWDRDGGLNNITEPTTITALWAETFPSVITSTQADIPELIVGESVQFRLEAGGTTPIEWFFYEGDWPPGLRPITRPGWISGTPTVAGTFTFTVRAINAHGFDEATFNIEVRGLDPTGISFTLPAVIRRNQTVTPALTVLPAGALQEATWTSSNPALASVNRDTGEVTARATSGIVVITATTLCGNFRHSVTVRLSA